jgi:hypothetical protein
VGAVVASTGATNVDLTAMTIIVQGTGDTTPNAFSFVPVTGAMPGAVITSAAATITGIDTPAPISVANGSYSIGCTGTFVTAAGTITNGQSVCVRHTASASISTSITTTLTIGGVSAAFTSTTAATTANLQVTQVYPSAGIGTGFDHVFNVIVRNLGAEAATGVTLTDTLPAGSRFIWATPGCTHAAGVVTCAIGTMNAGEVLACLFVVRPPMPGAITNTATIASSLPDVDQANNTSTLTSQVAATPAGVPVDRYRLYSLILLRHHFTTSSNEYNTLVSFAGAWVGEGVAGRLLDRPGTYNGVEAVPFYRLYIPATQGHLWTADPNEYYTLHFIYRYASEGVDGFILPTQAPGTVPLHRLFYPAAQPANTRHLWTLDANERAALLASGWTDEGVAGYVIP